MSIGTEARSVEWDGHSCPWSHSKQEISAHRYSQIPQSYLKPEAHRSHFQGPGCSQRSLRETEMGEAVEQGTIYLTHPWGSVQCLSAHSVPIILLLTWEKRAGPGVACL